MTSASQGSFNLDGFIEVDGAVSEGLQEEFTNGFRIT